MQGETTPSEAGGAGPSPLPPAGNWKRDTVLFLASQNISLFGSALVQYAITWYITLTTRSGVMLTAAIICGFLPTFFISPFAGVWADRYHRKNIIMLSDALIALSTLALAVLFLTGHGALWLLLVVSVIRSLGTGVQTPAVGALLPQIVPAGKLTRVNATNGSLQALVTLISPMLAGALLTVTSIEVIFFVDVVTAAIAVGILLFYLHVPSHAKALARRATGYFADLRQGIRYIRAHAFLKAFFLFSLFFFFLVAPVAFLSPLQVTRSFGGDVWRLTAVEVSFSLGALLGGVVMASWGGFQNKAHSMALSSLMMGAFTLALGVTPIFWLYLAFMGILGISMPIFNVPATVLLQQKTEPDFLGRVFGVLTMISSVMMPLGMLVFGPLADLVRVEWMLVGTGLLMFGEGLLMLRSRALLEAGRPVAPP